VTILFHKHFGRNWFPIIASVIALLLAAGQAGAIIGLGYQMQLGNPSGAIADTNNHDHYLIERTVETIDYSDNLGEPNWASWDLTTSDTGSSGRSPDFLTDTNLPPDFYEVPGAPNPYSGSGFDRGHMCPSGDRTDTTNDNAMVFLMSNIIPQAPTNNEVVWENFESYCRGTLAAGGNEVLITCGPSGFGSTFIAGGKVAVATYTWKIAVAVPAGDGFASNRITAYTRVIALKIPNSNSVSSAWTNYVTSARQIELDTGYTFFTALPSNLAWVLRSKVDGQTPAAPAISDFSPASGDVAVRVTIAGTNLSFATNVTFNGTSASFSIDSPTQLTALVPDGATSGSISVMTLGGSATSFSSFIVGATTNVDLAIAATHTGNFTQGDTNDTYTILVSNIGNEDSAGVITVTDTLPTGLTAIAIGGAGWTADLNTLTCTYSGSIASGASSPPITLTVNVSSNSASSVTNVAAVSGGGDANSLNNTASDATIITPSSSPGELITLAGWDTSGSTNYGPSSFPPTTNATNVTVGGLLRGSGVGTSGSGAARGWGGNNFAGASAAAAVSSSQFVTFTVTANPGYQVSFSAISRFDYRRSSTGPPSGVLQYQVGSGEFSDITNLSYTSSASSGASLGPISLLGIPALQNVAPGTLVTFRIVNYGGGSSGTWYIFDVLGSPAPDLEIQGILTTGVPPQLTLQPTNQVVLVGGSCQFNAAGAGTAPLLYQWWFNETNLLTGATNSTLVLTNVSLNQAGSYSVRILNDYGQAVSVPATLTVQGAPSIDGLSWVFSATNPVTGSRTATLSATVNPNSLDTVAFFEYGLTPAYAGSSAPTPLAAANTAGEIAAALDSLMQGVTYHCRVVASNSAGAAYSSDQSIAVPSLYIPGDVNGDGIVDQGELNAVLANYWPNSPWVWMTNTAGLGSTNVQFSLTNTVAWNFSVLVSTNLVDWQYLGTASPVYQFGDTQATNAAQRFYRLRWP
jgi:uncharacterized repeat protein (TIGR01451 family)